MKKKILILSNRIDRVLHDNLQKHSKNDVYYSSYRFLSFKIKQSKVEIYDHKNNLSLDEYSLVYFKQYELETSACIIFLEEKDIPFFNKDLGKNFIFNKLSQYIKLGLCDFLIPESFHSSHKIMKEAGKTMNYPLILKSISSSLGKDNFLVKDHKELCEILSSNRKTSFVIQEFIDNSFDYRILTLGNNLGTALKRIRQNKNDHRNNVALGAIEVEVISPPKELVSISIAAANCLNKDIAGVDLIFDVITNRYYIIEINSKPFFTNDTNVSSEVPQFTKYMDSLVNV
jgi:glutathione synthase/RimK-type ligase-like ATP-grasp enzyme